MPGSRSKSAATAILATVVALATGSVAAVDFSHEVVPILRAKCGKCHTGSQRQGGFSLNDREAILAGGDSGTPGLVAGDAARSELIRRIRSVINTWKSEVLLVGLFGSAARRDGNSSSDIDILIVSDSRNLKELADQLASQVTAWTGNPAQIVAINRKELKRLRQAREPIVGHWQSELVVISGDVRILQSSSK